MKVLVLGAGVIGVTSAYYLAKAGHAVTVIDRQQGAGLETSFANAGEISPGYSSPWAGPGVPVKAIKWLLMRHGPLAIRPTLDIRMYAWLAKMLRNCTAARYAVNKSRMLPIAEYSRVCLQRLRDETGITYDGRARGTLQLFRTQKQMDGVADDVAILNQYQVPSQMLDVAGCVAAEPGLAAVTDKFVGGLRLPNDETGDCYLFTHRLGEMAAALGVEFRYGTKIDRLVVEGGRISQVQVGGETLTADAYVVALASYAPLLLAPVGIDIPVYPVKGYSLTVPIADEASSPVSTVMDETYKIAITRLGDRIRVGGTAEIAGYSKTLRPDRRATLVHSLVDLFGGSCDPDKATFWTGLRPMTPDGPPLIGVTRYPNLFLNTGHGTLGWTMSCGSGALLADLVSGRRPEIDTAALSLNRYR